MKKKYVPYINRIFELAQKVNRADGAPTIFIEYMGHVELFTVRIHTRGWVSGETCDYKMSFYLDGSLEDSIQQLDDFCKVGSKLVSLQNLEFDKSSLEKEKIDREIIATEFKLKALTEKKNSLGGTNNG